MSKEGSFKRSARNQNLKHATADRDRVPQLNPRANSQFYFSKYILGKSGGRKYFFESTLYAEYAIWLRDIVPKAIVVPIDHPLREERLEEVGDLLHVKFGPFPHLNKRNKRKRKHVDYGLPIDHPVFDIYKR